MAEPIQRSMDSDLVECWALWKVMNFVRDLGIRNIHIEGDSLTVIKAIISAGEDRSYLGGIMKATKAEADKESVGRLVCLGFVYLEYGYKEAQIGAHSSKFQAVSGLLLWLGFPVWVGASLLFNLVFFLILVWDGVMDVELTLRLCMTDLVELGSGFYPIWSCGRSAYLSLRGGGAYVLDE
ncbi:hypothetical protein U1Q18_007269 [Sarracenia purpurea var. burkii]